MSWLRNLFGHRAEPSAALTPPSNPKMEDPPVSQEVPEWFDLMKGVDDAVGSVPPDYDGTRPLADKGWAGLTTTTQGAFTKLQNEAYKMGISIYLTEGFRPRRRQAYLYSLGRKRGPAPHFKWDVDPMSKTKVVTKAIPGKSNHQSGQAFDIAIKGANPYDENSLAMVGAKAMVCGLQWGGTWTFQDKPHFQLIGVS